MKTYEAMFLVDTRHANRDWDRVVDQVQEMVTKHGGDIIRSEKWGERKLAYPIAGNKRGVYLLVYFQAEGDAPNQVYREVELSETFLRAMILALDKTRKEIEAEAEKGGAEEAAGTQEETPAKPAAEAAPEGEAPAEAAPKEEAPAPPAAEAEETEEAKETAGE